MRLVLQFFSAEGITSPEANDALTRLMHTISRMDPSISAEIPMTMSDKLVDLKAEVTVTSTANAAHQVWRVAYEAREALQLQLKEIYLFADSSEDRLELSQRLQGKWPDATYMERISTPVLEHAGKCG